MTYDPAAIKELRHRLKLTQDELASEIGVDRSNVSRWEKGLTRPRGAAMKLLAALSTKKARAEGKAA